MEDAASKLLLVPASGNKLAEEAAEALNVPIGAICAQSKSGLAQKAAAALEAVSVCAVHLLQKHSLD